MRHKENMFSWRAVLTLFFAGGIIALTRLAGGVEPAQAQTPEEMFERLNSKKQRTRSFSAQRQMQRFRQLVDKKHRTRGLARQDRNELLDIVVDQNLPTLDLEILFEFASADISAASFGQLKKLATVLKRPEFAGSKFMLLGHTDSKGSENYNLTLSQRRADAVQFFLRNVPGIGAGRFFTVGYGAEKPKNSQDTTAAENRRVQVINLADF
ncbi:MAG: OmpA family protein [Alphaproteobacteria bacterium]|nr:OmpA family protein [Alphaproteobacteria bacterium]